MTPVFRLPRACGPALITLLLALNAHAELGGSEATIATDAQALGAMPVRQVNGSQVSWQIKAATTTVHEYVGAGGQVYAVSFDGAATPNLDLLLGSHAAEFNANVRHDRRSAFVSLPGLQARLHGHPGAIGGVVWLPGLLPAGVNAGGLP